MAGHVAFLRAINVGGRRVTMDRLRDVFERLELDGRRFDDVSTYIASGNVCFDATGSPAALEATIEAGLADGLGFEVVTFVRTVAQLRKVVAVDPFPEQTSADTYLVAFLKVAPTAPSRRALEALSGEVDTLRVHGKELHWLIRGKSMDSRVTAKAMAKAAGDGPATTRNITMLRKLAERL